MLIQHVYGLGHFANFLVIYSGKAQNRPPPPNTVILTIFVCLFFPRNQSEGGMMHSPSNDTSLATNTVC